MLYSGILFSNKVPNFFVSGKESFRAAAQGPTALRTVPTYNA